MKCLLNKVSVDDYVNKENRMSKNEKYQQLLIYISILETKCVNLSKDSKRETDSLKKSLESKTAEYEKAIADLNAKLDDLSQKNDALNQENAELIEEINKLKEEK